MVQSDDKSRSKESTKSGTTPAVPQTPGGKEQKKAKAKVCCSDFFKYVLIVTDNVKLFSYDMSELLRFRGKPITPFDKCQSLLWIVSVLFFWVSVILALSWVGGKSSEMVMQTTSEHAIQGATYNISDVLGPIHIVTYFEAASLLSKARSLQGSKPAALGSLNPHSRLLPQEWSQMSDEDKAWLGQMLCTGVQVTFVETRSMWINGEQKPFEQNAFPFKCQMLLHADDRVRVYFHQ